MSIRKIINSVLIWLLLFSLLGTVSMFVMLNLNQGNARVVNYAGMIRGGSQRLVKLEMGGKDTDEIVTKMDIIITGLMQGSTDLKITAPKDTDFLNQMNIVYSYWQEDLKPIIISYKYGEDATKLIEKSEQFFEMTNKAVDYAEIFSAKGIDFIKMVNIIIFLLNVVCIALISLIIYRKILIPIREIYNAAGEMKQGNLAVMITHHSNDELGYLADNMRSTIDIIKNYITNISECLKQMSDGDIDIKIDMEYIGDFKKIKISLLHIAEGLSKTMSLIGQTAEQVSSGSKLVSSGSQVLSQGAAQQASAIEELVVSINDISYQVKMNAESAGKASKKADAVGYEMKESNNHMQNMIVAMDEINKSSYEIGKIIKTIEDIAFQTNILALNAAVEAARAGTAGKGFAVVADEVRNLASKSAEASKNTSTLIENSIKVVGNGTEIVDATAKSLLSAVNGASDMIDIIGKIFVASNEQSNSINNVTLGMEQISSVVQVNSATAEESACASIELSQEAQILKDLVGKFHFQVEK